MVLVRQAAQPDGDGDAEMATYRRSIEQSIADRAAAGLPPTAHLLRLLNEIEPTQPPAAPVFEHAAAEPLETTMPRRPARPVRKPTDADRAAGS